MKAFQLVQTIGSVAVIGIMALVWGLPAAPAVLFYEWASDAFGSSTAWIDAVWTGLTLSSTAIVYMLLLIFFSALIQFVLHVRIKEHTVVRLHSMTTIRWAICGQIGRSTRPVLQHLVPSFVANAYFRICGAKIQIGAQINSALLNDPNLLTDRKSVV